MVLHEILTKKKCNWNVSCGRMFMHKWLLWIYLQRFKRICIESSNGEPKNWHKLNARSSMVLHEKLTKKKCNWNVFHVAPCSCTKWPVLDLLGTGPKRYASKALMVNQKIGTSWMQGLQWYSMRNSPKRNVIEMFHMAACSCTNGLLWIYLAKVQKNMHRKL